MFVSPSWQPETLSSSSRGQVSAWGSTRSRELKELVVSLVWKRADRGYEMQLTIGVEVRNVESQEPTNRANMTEHRDAGDGPQPGEDIAVPKERVDGRRHVRDEAATELDSHVRSQRRQRAEQFGAVVVDQILLSREHINEAVQHRSRKVLRPAPFRSVSE